jgi:superfamily II DNA/RNA helicase
MGIGYKANAVYGRIINKIELKHLSPILIGTPGRLADPIRRENSKFLCQRIQKDSKLNCKLAQ